ncbi:MAG: hypothetical protein ACYTFW_21405 [Planctomycetota bacterium]|jgi:hypothetical protein
MTNEIEILDRLGKLELELSEIKQLVLTQVNKIDAPGKQLLAQMLSLIIEDVICPPAFPEKL